MLEQLLFLHKELEPPKRKVTVTALRTDQIPHRNLDKIPESVQNMVDLVEKTLQEQPYTDLLLTPEYSFFISREYGMPLEFEYKGNEFQVTRGESSVVRAIHTLRQLAIKYISNIVVGTVCEREEIEEVAVYHNSALVIDNNGKIVQKRRKFTGSDACKSELKADIYDFMYTRRTSTLSSQFNPQTKNMTFENRNERIASQAVWNAIDTIKPITLKTKNNRQFSVLVCICAERVDPFFSVAADGANADILLIANREGDDFFTERSQIRLLGKIVENTFKGRCGAALEEKDAVVPYHGDDLINIMMDHKVISPRGVWVASDATFDGQVGVFPTEHRESIITAHFSQDSVTAECEL